MLGALIITLMRRVSISKRLTLVLRHKPEILGLTPDERGYVPLEGLLSSFERKWRVRSDEVLDVLLSDEERFEVSNGKVRARYGHSYHVDPGNPLKPDEVPPVLYHGTVESAWRSISKTGIKPMGRAFVHLSASVDKAIQVAHRRKGRRVLLEIDGRELARRRKVWKASNLVYLTDYVPPELITSHRYI